VTKKLNHHRSESCLIVYDDLSLNLNLIYPLKSVLLNDEEVPTQYTLKIYCQVERLPILDGFVQIKLIKH